jgi:hypothetical protein
MTGSIHPYEQEGVFQKATPWLMAAQAELKSNEGRILGKYSYAGVDYTFKMTVGSVWVLACWSAAGQVAFRAGDNPSPFLGVNMSETGEQTVDFSIDTVVGKMRVAIEMPSDEHPVLHWTTSITLDRETMFPYWPRDVYVLSQDDDLFKSRGTVHAMQRGPKAGLVYLTVREPRSGSMFYLQNLTRLNQYADHAHTSLGKTVGGEWPELGFALPPSQKPLPAGEEIILSDGFAQLSPTIPKDSFEAARLFIDLYADVYLQLPWVECEYHDWPARAEQTLAQLTRSSQVSLKKDGKQYFIAYVNSKDKPVEVMVQAAMLISAVEYESWRKKPIPLINRTRKVLPEFYDPKIKSLIRWQPQMHFPDGKLEEQEHARIMDSWYLYHP